jgi:putative transposase
MARPLRLQFPDALYHLTARGDRREPIVADDEDRVGLLEVWREALARFDAICFAYCLMGNHYHFIVQTHRANLSQLMRHVNGVYTQRYNRRHRQVGHLFQGRYKAILVDRDAYFLEVCRYVELNPVRAKLAPRPEDWPWSSYRAHVGLDHRPDWLDSEQIYRQLAATDARARRRYAEFVSRGRNVRLWEEALAGQIYLGDEGFVKAVQRRTASRPESREVPRAHRRAPGASIESYLRKGRDRDAGIAAAYLEGGHTQTAIARALGLSVSRVSRLIKRYEDRRPR